MNDLGAAAFAASTFLGATNGLTGPTVVDQVFDPMPTPTTKFEFDARALAQTFTVGVAGELDSVQVFLDPNGGSSNISFQIWRTTGSGVPDINATPLATSPAVEVSGIARWFEFDFSADELRVRLGDVFAVARPGSPTVTGSWVIGQGDPPQYADGQAFQELGGMMLAFDDLPGEDEFDFLFKTFVTLPEPASFAMVLFGLAGLAGVARAMRR